MACMRSTHKTVANNGAFTRLFSHGMTEEHSQDCCQHGTLTRLPPTWSTRRYRHGALSRLYPTWNSRKTDASMEHSQRCCRHDPVEHLDDHLQCGAFSMERSRDRFPHGVLGEPSEVCCRLGSLKDCCQYGSLKTSAQYRLRKVATNMEHSQDSCQHGTFIRLVSPWPA